MDIFIGTGSQGAKAYPMDSCLRFFDNVCPNKLASQGTMLVTPQAELYAGLLGSPNFRSLQARGLNGGISVELIRRDTGGIALVGYESSTQRAL